MSMYRSTCEEDFSVYRSICEILTPQDLEPNKQLDFHWYNIKCLHHNAASWQIHSMVLRQSFFYFSHNSLYQSLKDC